MPKPRLTDPLRLSFITIALLVLLFSFGLGIKAQTQNQLDLRIKEVEATQKADQSQITAIDKRLLVIETKQDAIMWMGTGVLAGLGLLLLERAKDLLFPRSN